MADKGVMIAIGKMRPGGKPEGEESGEGEGLKASAEEILSAIEEKDASALAAALKDFFLQVDEGPHEEGEHTAEEE